MMNVHHLLNVNDYKLIKFMYQERYIYLIYGISLVIVDSYSNSIAAGQPPPASPPVEQQQQPAPAFTLPSEVQESVYKDATSSDDNVPSDVHYTEPESEPIADTVSGSNEVAMPFASQSEPSEQNFPDHTLEATQQIEGAPEPEPLPITDIEAPSILAPAPPPTEELPKTLEESEPHLGENNESQDPGPLMIETQGEETASDPPMET